MSSTSTMTAPMRRGKIWLTFLASVTLVVPLALAAAPAQAAPPAPPKPDAAQTIITMVTGTTATDVASVAGQRRLRQELPQGTRSLAVLTAGQSSATFTGLIPAGSKITPKGKDFSVLTPAGVAMTIGAPWAVDAAGKTLTTSYTFTGNAITQKVDTTGATFPVVADPTVTFGPKLPILAQTMYMHLNRTEVFQAYYSGHLDYYTMGMYACNLMARTQRVMPCSFYVKSMIVNIGTGVHRAANSYTGTATACVAFKWYMQKNGGFPVYNTYSLERC
jgi:hypothetical protein